MIVIDSEKDKSMIPDLFGFKDKMTVIARVCFQHKKKYLNQVREGFKFVVNIRYINQPNSGQHILLQKSVQQNYKKKP